MAAVHPQPSQEPLPPGWECRYDPRTARLYFLNHIEHITTWEDPRVRHAPVQQGSYAKHYLYGTGRQPPGQVKSYPPYGTVHYTATVTAAPPPPPPAGSPVPSSVPAQVTNFMKSTGKTADSMTYRLKHEPPTKSAPPKKQPLCNCPILVGGYSPHYCSPRTPYRFKEGVQVDERTLMKLCLQFPTVEEGHIWQLLKQYHNRENVVVSALLAEGHPRAQTHSLVYEQVTPKLQRQNESAFQVDEALYHKLLNFFPAVDGDHIRNLQKMYNNQEHEVIAALASGNRSSSGRHPSPHPSSPKMKLRYLKLVFPEVDENVLFDVLYNCDSNAQEASNRLINMGYKKRDTPITRPNSSHPFQRPVLEIPRPSPPPERPLIVIPPSASDKLQLVSRLQEQFPAISRTLVNMALDSSNYNEDRAKQFLSAMTPQDGARPVAPQVELPTPHDSGTGTMQSDTSQIPFPPEAPPVPPRSRHASASQDSDTASGSRHSSAERHSLRGDSSREATPSKSPSQRSTSISSPVIKAPCSSTIERTGRPKFKKEIFKISKATSTQEDSEILPKYRTRPKGPDPNIRKGPCESLLLYVSSALQHGSNSLCMCWKEYLPWKGPDPKNRKGPDPSLRRGPDPRNIGARTGSRAMGPQKDLRIGSLAGITHSKISSTNTENIDTEADNSRSS